MTAARPGRQARLEDVQKVLTRRTARGRVSPPARPMVQVASYLSALVVDPMCCQAKLWRRTRAVNRRLVAAWALDGEEVGQRREGVERCRSE